MGAIFLFSLYLAKTNRYYLLFPLFLFSSFLFLNFFLFPYFFFFSPSSFLFSVGTIVVLPLCLFPTSGHHFCILLLLHTRVSVSRKGELLPTSGNPVFAPAIQGTLFDWLALEAKRCLHSWVPWAYNNHRFTS